MNIDTMEAGLEMDILVLKKIFGVKKVYSDEDDADLRPRYVPSGKPMRTHRIDSKPVPYFSTYDAWQVVEKMLKTKWLKLHSPWHPGDKWWADFIDHGWNGQENPAEAETASLAICRAALKA